MGYARHRTEQYLGEKVIMAKVPQREMNVLTDSDKLTNDSMEQPPNVVAEARAYLDSVPEEHVNKVLDSAVTALTGGPPIKSEVVVPSIYVDGFETKLARDLFDHQEYDDEVRRVDKLIWLLGEEPVFEEVERDDKAKPIKLNEHGDYRTIRLTMYDLVRRLATNAGMNNECRWLAQFFGLLVKREQLEIPHTAKVADRTAEDDNANSSVNVRIAELLKPSNLGEIRRIARDRNCSNVSAFRAMLLPQLVRAVKRGF